MSRDQMANIFAALTVVSVLVALAMAVVYAMSLSGSVAARHVRESQSLTCIGAAAMIATTCSVGSLYLSEVANYEPCRFCWFQRTMMYPLAVVLIVGWIRRDLGAKWAGIVLATVGGSISIYHLLIEHQVIKESEECLKTGPSCALRYIDKLGGWITVPSMALAGFVTVIVLLLNVVPSGADNGWGDDTEPGELDEFDDFEPADTALLAPAATELTH